MQAQSPAVISKSSNGPRTAALASGFAIIGIGFLSFLIAIVHLASSHLATPQVLQTLFAITLVLIAIFLLFLAIFFKTGNKKGIAASFSVPLAASALGLMATTETFAIIGIFRANVNNAWAIFNLPGMVALSATFLMITSLARHNFKGLAGSLAFYTALAFVPVAVAYASLMLVWAFSYSVPGAILTPTNILSVLVYLFISAILTLLILSLFKEVRASKFALPALFSGVITLIVALIWTVLCLVNPFETILPYLFGYETLSKAILILTGLMFITWGTSLVLIILLESDLERPPIFLNAATTQAPLS